MQKDAIVVVIMGYLAKTLKYLFHLTDPSMSSDKSVKQAI